MSALVVQRVLPLEDAKETSAVYVDDPVWPYGRMIMCHMFAESGEALHAMADRIGIARRWFQDKPGFPHYDICKSKRELAVQLGAVEVGRAQFIQLVRRHRASDARRRCSRCNGMGTIHAGRYKECIVESECPACKGRGAVRMAAEVYSGDQDRADRQWADAHSPKKEAEA